jgi:autotransporter-associated beta strand protein
VLLLSSCTADSEVELLNSITITYTGATIFVNDNPFTDSDFATLSGVVSSNYAGPMKDGPGTLCLSGANTYTAATTVVAGAVRATDGVGLPAASNLVLGGGVFEGRDTAAFVRSLGNTGANTVQWTGSGGFSAFGGKMTVAIGGIASPTALIWGSGSFVPSGSALVFGSATASNETELKNNMNLGGAVRTVTVNDNPLSAGDFATLSGILSNGSLTKDGPGRLVLSAANPYAGGTAVRSGTLIAAATGALGSGAVSLGDIVGSNDAALLIDGTCTLSAHVTVQDDGSLTSLRTLGGDGAGEAVFLGDITVRKALALTAAPGGTVRFSGMLDNAEGHTIMKVGDGIVILDGFQTQGSGALLDVDAGTVLLNSDAGSGTSANLSISVTDAVVKFGSNQHLDTLNIGDGGEVVFAGAHVVMLQHLVMDGIDFGATTLTPEPATLGLLALGGLLALRRRC